MLVLLYHLVELVLLILPRVEALVDLVLTNHCVVGQNLTPDVLTCSQRESPITNGHCTQSNLHVCVIFSMFCGCVFIRRSGALTLSELSGD